MKHLLNGLAAAAALMAMGSLAQAGVLTFNDPALLTIDAGTGMATYTEAGFSVQGAPATFLPIDGIGSGGSGALVLLANSVLSVTAVGGGTFSLQSLDFGLSPFDASGLGTGSLLVEGFMGGSSATLSQQLTLADLGTFSFGSGWAQLSQVSFTASADAVLDNLRTVPEPTSLALVAATLAGFGLSRRRAHSGT